jgi:hypothetical protein
MTRLQRVGHGTVVRLFKLTCKLMDDRMCESSLLESVPIVVNRKSIPFNDTVQLRVETKPLPLRSDRS